MKMKNTFAIILLLLMFACQPPRLPQVEILTPIGKIMIEVDTIHAPVTGSNFLHLVDDSCYADACFYRVVHPDNQPSNKVKIEVIQGGLKSDSLIALHAPIRHEPTSETGIKHLNGVISMARVEPGSASTEIFICINDQPELDFGGKRNPDGQGFAAFGRVIEGMDIVTQIQTMPNQSQMLLQVVPFSIRRIKSL